MVRLLQHPAALIFFCFALVGTPVTYRGGAPDAHPHMFLEFLLDASAGSFAHYHGGDPAAPVDSSDGHDHAHAAGLEHDTADSDPDPAQPAVDGTERFAPTLSAFVVGDVGQLAYIFPQNDLPLTGVFATAFHPFSGTVTGLTHAPDALPPR